MTLEDDSAERSCGNGYSGTCNWLEGINVNALKSIIQHTHYRK